MNPTSDQESHRGPEISDEGNSRHAGAYGFSRTEIAALLVVVALTGAFGLYRLWQAETAPSAPGWMIEDVVVDAGSRPSPSPATTEEDSVPQAPSPEHTLMDVNTADEDDLVRLPGIGRELARRIIRERQERGAFVNLRDFQRVKGIGPKKAAALAGWVRFSAPGPDKTADTVTDQ